MRLKDLCPEAAPHAVIAGDPCFDRLTASLPWHSVACSLPPYR
jgi:hypothetical protein